MRNILSESNWLCLEIQGTLEFQFRLKMIVLLGDAKRERDGKTNETGSPSPVPFSSSPSWPGRRGGGERFCTATTPPVCIIQSTTARNPEYSVQMKLEVARFWYWGRYSFLCHDFVILYVLLSVYPSGLRLDVRF